MSNSEASSNLRGLRPSAEATNRRNSETPKLRNSETPKLRNRRSSGAEDQGLCVEVHYKGSGG